MKIKITHQIPGNPEFKVGFVYGFTAKGAELILENDWGFVVKEEKKKGKEADDGDGQDDS